MNLKTTVQKIELRVSEKTGSQWYSIGFPGKIYITTFSPKLVEGIKEGDYVDVEFTEKPSQTPGQPAWKNLVSIKKIEKLGEPEAKKGYTEAKDKSIIKQVAYKVAVEAIEKLSVTDEISDEGLLRYLETLRKISHAVYLDIMQEWE